MRADEFFGSQWETLVPGLRSALARAGAPAADRDDLVQETALRLYRMWDNVDFERPIEPLARQIALNAWRDQWRRRGEREVIGEVPDRATEVDTERAALARIEVQEVSRALSTLSPTNAKVLRLAASEAEGPSVRGTAAAVRMARTRARRALLASLKVASAVAAFVALSGKWVARPARTTVGTSALAAIACVWALSTTAPAPQISIRPQSDPAQPVTRVAPAPGEHAQVPSTGTERVHRSRAAETAPVHAADAEKTPYRVDAGPAQVDVFADVNVMGRGVRVSKPAADTSVPVCTYGSSPTAPLVARCAVG